MKCVVASVETSTGVGVTLARVCGGFVWRAFLRVRAHVRLRDIYGF